MNYDIVEALSQIAREKGVELRVLVERLEASLLSAAKRKHGVNAQITVNFDEDQGGIEMHVTKTVVGHVTDQGLEMTSAEARKYKAEASVGDDIVIPLDIMEFGRNAIQAAKQVLIQGVREAERERVYTDFADKVGSLVRGVVQQVDRGTIVLKLDTAEAIIPAREVLHRDRFRQREMVRALVIDVDKEAKGPQIILSRTHPDFLVKLFASEVPEITEHIVQVKAVAREPGHRSKIAVSSNDDRVDAVGACVGIKGSRVQAIVKELGGERIDIVPWSADPVAFVSRSLAPSKVVDAKVDPETRKVTVIVPDDQLSLAIGKQGQNARLAAKLTGWKIELHSESEYATASAMAKADVNLGELEEVTEEMVTAFEAAGIHTAVDIEKAGLDALQEIEGIPGPKLEQIFGLALEALAVSRAAAIAEAEAEAAAQAMAEGANDDVLSAFEGTGVSEDTQAAFDDTEKEVEGTAEVAEEASSEEVASEEVASEEVANKEASAEENGEAVANNKGNSEDGDAESAEETPGDETTVEASDEGVVTVDSESIDESPGA